MMIENWIFIALSFLKSMGIIAGVLFLVSYTVLIERWMSAMIQDRLGPNRVGIPFTKIRLWGLGQPIADALKLLFKEEFTPNFVKKFYFYLAPILVVIPTLIVLCVVPFGSTLDLRPLIQWANQWLQWPGETLQLFDIPAVVANLDIGILFVFAIVSFGVYGIMLAGWSSNSKYPFLGGIRASAQMISYELCLGLAIIPVIMQVGGLSFPLMVQYQINHSWLAFAFITTDFHGWIMSVPLLISFFIFLVASFAETNRLPFDLPECEAELVSGYHTEYSSMKFALFFLGEYTAMIATSAIIVTVFFGGWSLPLPWFNGQSVPFNWPILAGMDTPWWFGWVHVGVFMAKLVSMLLFFIWIRWTLPRFRYDQLMSLGWKVFIPLGLANVFLTAILMIFCRHF